MPPVAEPEETGRTFAENARAKALYYAQASGGLVVAEDSGLEIDALDGAPGVYSARFGGDEAPTYPEKFALIFRMLKERGADTSPARFVCALALAEPGRVVFEARGTVEGEVRMPPGEREASATTRSSTTRRSAGRSPQVPAEKKAEVSHRGKAFRELGRVMSS